MCVLMLGAVWEENVRERKEGLEVERVGRQVGPWRIRAEGGMQHAACARLALFQSPRAPHTAGTPVQGPDDQSVNHGL